MTEPNLDTRAWLAEEIDNLDGNTNQWVLRNISNADMALALQTRIATFRAILSQLCFEHGVIANGTTI